jgi:hypothetical protein
VCETKASRAAGIILTQITQRKATLKINWILYQGRMMIIRNHREDGNYGTDVSKTGESKIKEMT